jgi:hypothetical protein
MISKNLSVGRSQASAEGVDVVQNHLLGFLEGPHHVFDLLWMVSARRIIGVPDLATVLQAPVAFEVASILLVACPLDL